MGGRHPGWHRRQTPPSRTPRAGVGPVVAALLTTLLLSACTAGDGGGVEAPTAGPVAPTALPVTPGAPPPPGATGAPVIGVSTVPPVPVGDDAPFGDVPVVATATRIDGVQVEARGPGELAGPGIAATIRVENRGDRPIDLAGMVVNATYGDAVPASPSGADPAAPLTGPLAPGATGEGVYVFQVPEGSADGVVVEVGYSGSANVVLIQG